jgi:hypothetical protein
MKTDALIRLLATGVEAVDPHLAERRFARAIGFGLAAAGLLMALLLGVRSDLQQALQGPMFWIKCAFVGSLLAAALFAAARLSRPGARLDGVVLLLVAPLLLMWALAGYVLISAAPAQRLALLLGDTWRLCPWLIALLSLPLFVAVIWAMRGLAPTRPRAAGFAAGLLAGAGAALVYCLHCPETTAPFIGLWYTLGMLIPAAVGALLGPRLLRW